MRILRLHPPLMVTAIMMGLLILVSGAGLLLDDRILLGVPIWLKPFKFAISVVIYAVTLAWLVSLLNKGRRLGWWLGTVIAIALTIELAVIVGQAVRGRTSHFNFATNLDATLFTIMAVMIVTLWLATAGIAILLLRQRIADRGNALAIRLGLLIALGGLAIGFLMTSPRPEQIDDPAMSVIGAHAVGVPDGGPGLPLVNWSTEGGDLRIGHFIGMHALQALPLFALALGIASRRIRRLRSEQIRARLVLVAAGGYASLTVLVTWQALRGQSVVSPDAPTLVAGTALLLAVGAGTLWAFARSATSDAASVDAASVDAASVDAATAEEVRR